MNTLFTKQQTFLIFASVIVVYIIGLFIDVMDVDAGQYASISREMLETKSFLIVKNRGQDYLDKPPLVFWLCSLSFQCFGVHTWSYKLPSLLFALLAIFSTYKLAKLCYSENIALLSAILLASCQAFFLITNDCRMDTVLTGSVIFAIWNLAAFIKFNSWGSLFAGFTGIALGLLTKGPIALVVPVFALGTDVLLKGNFTALFNWKWLIGIPVIALLLMPMCIGLYQQFGSEGLKFYFWTQSFGRITGESQWRNNGGFFFMFHSFMWSFLPWSIFTLPAIGFKIRSLFKSKNSDSSTYEYITLGGILLSYLVLSLSKYQLPHYIYVFFPLAAILTAAFMINTLHSLVNNKWIKTIIVFQYVVLTALWVICFLLSFLAFNAGPYQYLAFAVAVLAIPFLLIASKGFLKKTITLSLFTAISVNFFMDSHIYPSLLTYQPTHKVASELKKLNADKDCFFTNYSNQHQSLDFYCGFTVPFYKDSSPLMALESHKVYYCYTNTSGLKSIETNNFKITTLLKAENFPVTKLTIKFLNPSKRQSVIEDRFLIAIEKKDSLI